MSDATTLPTHDDYDTDDVCLRCAGLGGPAMCLACIGEVNAARESLAWMRAGTDPDHGRIDLVRWGW